MVPLKIPTPTPARDRGGPVACLGGPVACLEFPNKSPASMARKDLPEKKFPEDAKGKTIRQKIAEDNNDI